MPELIRLDVFVPNDIVNTVTGFLFSNVSHGWEERESDVGVMFRIHAEQPDFCQGLRQRLKSTWPEVRVEWAEVPQREWALAWREFFTAVPCGEDFIVIAPWMRDEQPFPERITIIIEPKMAFGTGHHPTTALCLEVLSGMHRKGQFSPGLRFLDLGTGSGILGLGAAKLGMHGIGLDTDPLAVENALENKLVNDVGKEFVVELGSVAAVAGERFDLILANILAEPLIDLAPEIAMLRKPGAALVLSGLLDIQRESVIQAYTSLGLPRPEEVVQGEWAALVWERSE